MYITTRVYYHVCILPRVYITTCVYHHACIFTTCVYYHACILPRVYSTTCVPGLSNPTCSPRIIIRIVGFDSDPRWNNTVPCPPPKRGSCTPVRRLPVHCSNTGARWLHLGDSAVPLDSFESVSPSILECSLDVDTDSVVRRCQH